MIRLLAVFMYSRQDNARYASFSARIAIFYNSNSVPRSLRVLLEVRYQSLSLLLNRSSAYDSARDSWILHGRVSGTISFL